MRFSHSKNRKQSTTICAKIIMESFMIAHYSLRSNPAITKARRPLARRCSSIWGCKKSCLHCQTQHQRRAGEAQHYLQQESDVRHCATKIILYAPDVCSILLQHCSKRALLCASKSRNGSMAHSKAGSLALLNRAHSHTLGAECSTCS